MACLGLQGLPESAVDLSPHLAKPSTPPPSAAPADRQPASPQFASDEARLAKLLSEHGTRAAEVNYLHSQRDYRSAPRRNVCRCFESSSLAAS